MFQKPDPEYIKKYLNDIDIDSLDRLSLVHNIVNISVFNSSAYITLTNMLRTENVADAEKEDLIKILTEVRASANPLIDLLCMIEDKLGFDLEYEDMRGVV